MSDGYFFPVERTPLLLFASALGETNRIYYDEQYAKDTALGGVIAPPTFPMASAHWNPDHLFRGVRRIPPSEREARASGERGSGSGGTERRSGGVDIARVLHGEQRFEYHKPMRPGMRLHVTTRPGRSWEKQGRRGGRLRFTEAVTEYRGEDGELVVTATGVGITTEKAVEE